MHPDDNHGDAETIATRLAYVHNLQVSGRLHEARVVVDRLLVEMPGNADVVRAFARIAVQMQDSDHALTALRRQWHHHPDAAIACDIGRLLGLGGDHSSAQAWFERAVALNPDSIEAQFFLGFSLVRAGRPGDALHPLRLAYSAGPNNQQILEALADAEFHAGQDAEALGKVEAIIRCRPDDEDWLLKQGELLCRMGRHEDAIAHYKSNVSRQPGFGGLWMALAQSLEEKGDADGAEHAYREALRCRPAWAQPLAGLLSMRRGDADPADVELAASLLDGNKLNVDETALLAYPLGRVLDARRDHHKAFAYWTMANSARRQEVGEWDPQELTASLLAQLEVPAPAKTASADHRGLLFVVGMPRSGTTLVEQILDAHPEVTGCGELPFISDLSMRLPLAFEPDAGRLQAEADAYLAFAERVVGQGSRWLVDKAPLNAFHLGLVARLFPGARVIWCRRDARDVALSIYSENFSKAARFSTELDGIGALIEAQHSVMRHWQDVLALPILEVRYEALVSDVDAGARRLLDFCDLQWNENVSSFHASGKVVQTPSRWQVRQPAHTGSIGRWRAYSEWLRALDRYLLRPCDDDGVVRT